MRFQSRDIRGGSTEGSSSGRQQLHNYVRTTQSISVRSRSVQHTDLKVLINKGNKHLGQELRKHRDEMLGELSAVISQNLLFPGTHHLIISETQVSFLN